MVSPGGDEKLEIGGEKGDIYDNSGSGFQSGSRWWPYSHRLQMQGKSKLARTGEMFKECTLAIRILLSSGEIMHRTVIIVNDTVFFQETENEACRKRVQFVILISKIQKNSTLLRGTDVSYFISFICSKHTMCHTLPTSWHI